MIKEILNTAQIQISRLQAAKSEIEKQNLDKLDLNNIEVIKSIDFFIFRFIKVQDYLGNKVFKIFLSEIGEYSDNMSFVDITDKLEKIGIIDNSREWLEIRKLRNKLTHEYPEELNKTIEELKTALKKTEVLISTFENIKNYLTKKGILDR